MIKETSIYYLEIQTDIKMRYNGQPVRHGFSTKKRDIERLSSAWMGIVKPQLNSSIFTLASCYPLKNKRSKINLLLTMREERTGEYWSEVRSVSRSVRKKTAEG